ncbi:hypothetical protein Sme01_09390 [Sphaerisporangium melleum]|uniref:Fibronectin type-III domain-containing protein n=1 Tax=Sphaerisporangium melleum TaxID=321316 RepID=A0A917VEG2_9ACTN|nr:hypothetical protein [Sphaerisporangium melleum]GGK67552.1 hypothetical protein GCM10007964_08220 [Sphaerisporangium melleum]GII68463.1 hypothetical protein Sme01_09390 [Sphaerisporangium melleum]
MAGKHALPVLAAVLFAGGAGSGVAAPAATAGVSSAPRPSAVAPPDTQPPTAPANLRLAEPTPCMVVLTWDPSTDPPNYPPPHGVVAYDVYAGGRRGFRLIGRVPGNVTTFTDRVLFCAKVSYFVVARDAAGNVSEPSDIVTRFPPKICHHKHRPHGPWQSGHEGFVPGWWGWRAGAR